MSVKMQVPDELLDMVSGGKLHYGGDYVQDIYVTDEKDVIIKTETGKEYIYTEIAKGGEAVKTILGLYHEVNPDMDMQGTFVPYEPK